MPPSTKSWFISEQCSNGQGRARHEGLQAEWKEKVSTERCYVCKDRRHLARKCPLVIREHLAFNDAPGNGDYHAQMVAEESYDAEESVMKVETTKVKDPLAFALGTDSSGTISNNIVFCWWAKEVQY